MRRIERFESAVGRGALIVAALLLLVGCDVKTEVAVTTSAEAHQAAAELRTQVAALEVEARTQRERADRLEAELAGWRESNVVEAGDGSLRVRLNTEAAVVLVFAILGLLAFLIARMKFAPARE